MCVAGCVSAILGELDPLDAQSSTRPSAKLMFTRSFPQQPPATRFEKTRPRPGWHGCEQGSQALPGDRHQMAVGFKDRGANLDKINDKKPLYPPRIFPDSTFYIVGRRTSQNL